MQCPSSTTSEQQTVPRYWRGHKPTARWSPRCVFNWKAETQGTWSRWLPCCRHGDGAGLRAASEGCEEAVMNSHLILKHCILLLHVEFRVCACACRMLASVVRVSVTGRNPRSMS